MIVNFDSFDRFETPGFLLCNPGAKYRDDGTISNAICYIAGSSDEEIIFNFNTTSELNFRVYKSKSDNAYELVKNRRMIFADDIGFFVITAIDEGVSSEGQYKDVTANSCEIELENKKIPAIGEINLSTAQLSGSYIENNTYDFETLLDKVIGACPLWTIGNIDDRLRGKKRTFEDVDTDTNVLSFLLSNMQEAYECIFEFDIIRRVINAYSQDDFVKQTDIHLTKDDFISELEVSEDSDEIYTALTALGEDDLGIQLINPLGSNTIYNFDYYLDWMSEELSNKVVEWETAVLNQLDPDYPEENIYKLRHGYNTTDGTRIKGYFELHQELDDTQSEIDRLSNLLYYYNQLYINISTSSAESDIQEYNNEIKKYGGSTENIPPAITTQNEVSAVKAAVAGYIEDCKNEKAKAVSDYTLLTSDNGSLKKNEDKIRAIINTLKMPEFFTAEQQEELSFYIYEGTYNDEYVSVTEDMPWYDVSGAETDRLSQIETLYERAQKQLDKISAPKCEYTADVENFVFQREFIKWGQQLNAGCLINVELHENDVAALFLSTITMNYHDKSLSFTFGSRFDRLDPKALYEDVLGNVRRTANSLNYVKDVLYPIKSGEYDAFKEALASSRNLAKGSAINATNQDIVIDDTGLLGRRSGDNGEYDPKQIKLTNTNLVFTDDGWDTCKTALGEIAIPDGNGDTAYGINAELLVGNLMMTSTLSIVDQAGNSVISADGDGIHANFPGYITGSNFGKTLAELDTSGLDIGFINDIDRYKKFIHVGDLGDGEVGVRIAHNGEDNGFYSQFTADELAFYSENEEGNSYEKNTWMSSDALNIRRARIFNDILLGCEDTTKSDPNYGKWAIWVDEDNGFGIYWNG